MCTLFLFHFTFRKNKTLKTMSLVYFENHNFIFIEVCENVF